MSLHPRCELCGDRHSSDYRCNMGVVSDPPTTIKDQFTDSQLDELVHRASVPNLATLFKKAKDAGIFKPGKEYGDSA